jgi:hypothetical protein
MTDEISAARDHAQQQRALLVELLRGSTTPPQDELGELADVPSCGFDGGARTPVPAPRDPVRDHDLLVGQLASLSRTFRSGLGF